MADSPAAIGEKIRKRRQVLGWTQAELAERCGVGASSVLNWEKGRHFPARKLARVEAVLGVSLTSDDVPLRPVDPELRRLINETVDDPAERRRVLGLLEGTLAWPREDAPGASHRNAG